MKNLFIGIDFSKEKVDVAVISAAGLEETAPRVYNQFASTLSGYRQLVKWVKGNSGGLDPSLWLFCGENTGGYSTGLCDYLFGKGYDMWLENAKCIKDSCGLRRQKSDRADAVMIAEYAMRNHDRAVMYQALSPSLCALREYFLYRQMLVRHRCSFVVRRGEKRQTMGVSPAKAAVSQSGRHMVTVFDREIEKIDQKIKEVVLGDEELRRTYEIVTSIPGVGTQNAVCLIAFTENFRRFGLDARKLACYCGVAPFGRDSGTSVHSEPRVNRMANRMVKAMLTQAALAAVRFCPVISVYYNRLLDRGKKTQVALNNVKNKLLHIITALVRKGTFFNSMYQLQTTPSTNSDFWSN